MVNNDEVESVARMRSYVMTERYNLLKRTPVIIKISYFPETFARALHNSFDRALFECFSHATKQLAQKAQNAKFGLVLHDEASILLSDYRGVNAQPWYGNDACDIASASASIATAHLIDEFARRFSGRLIQPSLRVQCFNVPHVDVVNYFAWRQRERMYAISMDLALQNVSLKDINGMTLIDVIDFVKLKKGIDTTTVLGIYKHGAELRRQIVTKDHAREISRAQWITTPAFDLSFDIDRTRSLFELGDVLA